MCPASASSRVFWSQSGVSEQWITSEVPSALSRSALSVVEVVAITRAPKTSELQREDRDNDRAQRQDGVAGSHRKMARQCDAGVGAGQGRSLVVPELLDKASRFR
jgi:hypothetical protein